MIKKNQIVLLTLLLFPFLVSAQKYELGAGLGMFNYKGDLNPSFRPQMVKPGATIFGRINFNPVLSLKADLSYGGLTGSDLKSNNPLNQARAYSFTSRIFEWKGQLEYNFFDFRASIGLNHYNWTPYIFAGFGQYKQSKREFSNGSIMSADDPNLGPAPMVPYGLGFKLKINKNINVSVETGTRQLLGSKKTDLLDGFGYSGDDVLSSYPMGATTDPKLLLPNTFRKDQYFFTNVTISYVFTRVVCP